MERITLDAGRQQEPVVFTQGKQAFSLGAATARLEIVVDAADVGKLYAVKSVLQRMGVEEIMESALLCHGSRKGRPMSYRGLEYTANCAEKVKIEMLVAADAVEALVATLVALVKAENVEDWRLYITPEVYPVVLDMAPRS